MRQWTGAQLSEMLRRRLANMPELTLEEQAQLEAEIAADDARQDDEPLSATIYLGGINVPHGPEVDRPPRDRGRRDALP